MRGKWLTAMLLLSLICAAGAQAENPPDEAETYGYYYNCFDWHCSAQYAKLRFDNPAKTEYADILMFILNTHLIRDVSAHTAKEVVEEDPGLAAAYCCDAVTGISRDQPHNQYRRINLEDASYYDDETAANVRAVVRSGYRHDWTDADLIAAQQGANAWLKAQGMDTIESLTHAQAMTATQLAVWLNANSARLTDADYYGMHDYSRYDKTTYDPVKVPSGVPKDSEAYAALNEANAKNVELFKQYLLALEGVPPETVIFTQERFVADSTMYADTPGLHSVTLRFSLEGTVSEQDSLALTVRIGNTKKRYQLGKNATLTSDSSGYYSVSFDGVDADALKNGVELMVSGTQVLADDAYFYEPRVREGENPRDVSQNLVGYEKAGTQTAVFAACTIHIDPKDVVIVNSELLPDTGDRGIMPYVIALSAVLGALAILAIKRRNT